MSLALQCICVPGKQGVSYLTHESVPVWWNRSRFYCEIILGLSIKMTTIQPEKPVEIHVNSKLFQPSVWDDFPMKRDNRLTNYVIQSDFELDIPERIKLPKGFQFIELKIGDHSDRIAQFLNQHYSNKPNKIVYTDEYIEFVYKSPKKHFKKLRNISIDHWLIGVEERSSGEMYGFISAKPMTYYMDGRIINGMFIDKLCTHASCRGKKMAIVLLKEMYRKLHAVGNDCAAIFHTGSDLPFQGISQKSTILEKSFIKDDEHLEEVREEIENLTQQREITTDPGIIKQLNVRIGELESISITPTNDIHQIRLANKRDINDLMRIYYNYTKDNRFYRIYNKKEFENVFLPKKDMIYTYVLTNSQGEVKDFVTINVFYDVNGKKIAYVWYISFFNEDLLDLFMKNVLYILKESDFDKVLCHEWFGVSKVLTEKLEFQKSENAVSSTMWYAFNYNTKTMTHIECGMNIHL